MNPRRILASLLPAWPICVLVAAGMLATLTAPVEAQSTKEDLVAAGDWEGLLAAMSKVSPAEPCKAALVDRMLLAHASIARERMGKAVEMFYCPARDSSGFEAWVSWTRDLAGRHADRASCAYLHGDALVRKNEVSRGIAELTRALTLKGTATDSSLILNARGVGRWILFERTNIDSVPGSGDEALKRGAQDDLIAAKRVADRAGFHLADCDANQAIVEFRNHLDLDRVARHFQLAFDGDPSFYLALNGHACTCAAAGKYEAFLQDMAKIANDAPGTPFLSTNAGGLVKGVKPSEAAMRGATTMWGVHAEVGGLFTKFLGNASLDFLKYSRGGFYTILKPGTNVHVTEGQPERRVVGTWFALNYPLWAASTSEPASARR